MDFCIERIGGMRLVMVQPVPVDVHIVFCSAQPIGKAPGIGGVDEQHRHVRREQAGLMMSQPRNLGS